MDVLSRVGLKVSAALLVLLLSSIAHPQKNIEGGKGSKESSPQRQPTTIVYRNKDRIVRVTPKTGSLTIVAEAGANIRLQSLKKGGEVSDESNDTIPQGQRNLIVNDLRPGRYRVIAELNGYKTNQGEVSIMAGNPSAVDLKLVPITYNIKVGLNAASGTVRYYKGGEDPRSVTFQNRQALLSGLTAGNYTLEVIADDAAYKPLKTTLTVSSDNQVSYDLERLESREFLGAAASAWALPNGWTFSSGKVIVHGRGIALPSDTGYSHYKDFRLSTNVNMVNGIAASFAVRAIDSQNYYLIQITGQKADEPYVLRGFIVRDGTPQRFGAPIPTNQFAEALKPGQFFQVVLTMKDAEITVRVQDSETGDLRKLGTLTDPSQRFRIGAVGIVARDNEQNEFENFNICVTGCPSP